MSTLEQVLVANRRQRDAEPPLQLAPIEDARRQYVELFGSALVMNTYLKIAVLCLAVVAAGLVVLNILTQRRYQDLKPLVVRIDDVGRGPGGPVRHAHLQAGRAGSRAHS
jgi:type IV secretory pathway TrbF-like protein